MRERAWTNSPQRRCWWYKNFGWQNWFLIWIWLFHICTLYRSEAKHLKEVGKSGAKQHLHFTENIQQTERTVSCFLVWLKLDWTWDHTGLRSLKQNKWTQTQRQLHEPLLRSRFHIISTMISGLSLCLQVTVHFLHHHKIWTDSGRRTYNDSNATTGLIVSSWVSRVVRSGLVIIENKNTQKTSAEHVVNVS